MPYVPRSGEFTISFDARSDLSGISVFMRRFGWPVAAIRKKDPRGDEYLISTESFEVYVPGDYQPDTLYGLFVWISPGDSGVIPEAYKPALDKYRLIWIGANKSGNDRQPWYRHRLAIDAAHNMQKYYTIDKKRGYVGGHRRQQICQYPCNCLSRIFSRWILSHGVQLP